MKNALLFLLIYGLLWHSSCSSSADVRAARKAKRETRAARKAEQERSRLARAEIERVNLEVKVDRQRGTNDYVRLQEILLRHPEYATETRTDTVRDTITLAGRSQKFVVVEAIDTARAVQLLDSLVNRAKLILDRQQKQNLGAALRQQLPRYRRYRDTILKLDSVELRIVFNDSGYVADVMADGYRIAYDKLLRKQTEIKPAPPPAVIEPKRYRWWWLLLLLLLVSLFTNYLLYQYRRKNLEK